MTKLQQLYDVHGQSPWFDNLTRRHLRRGDLARLVDAGIRGVTSNPTIFAKAISGSSDYDEQFRALADAGANVTDAYWSMVVDDTQAALVLLCPLYDDSGGGDGFVSVELAPDLAAETSSSAGAARDIHERIDEPKPPRQDPRHRRRGAGRSTTSPSPARLARHESSSSDSPGTPTTSASSPKRSTR